MSFRRSSVGDGMGTRTTLPSFVGFSPRSEVRMALSISGTTLGSHGEITSSVASGDFAVGPERGAADRQSHPDLGPGAEPDKRRQSGASAHAVADRRAPKG